MQCACAIIVICGLPSPTVFFHIISKNGIIFEKKITEYKMRVLRSSATVLKYCSF